MQRGELTLAEISKKYDVHPNMASAWKKQVAQEAAQLFALGAGKTQQASDEQIKELHAKIGQLTIEKDFFKKRVGTLSHCRRTDMTTRGMPNLSIVRQCELVSISRSSFYFTGKDESLLNLKLMRLSDEQFMERPYYGSRQMTRNLHRLGYSVGRSKRRTNRSERSRNRKRPPAMPMTLIPMFAMTCEIFP